jgi:hypothetical protein
VRPPVTLLNLGKGYVQRSDELALPHTL